MCFGSQETNLSLPLLDKLSQGYWQNTWPSVSMWRRSSDVWSSYPEVISGCRTTSGFAWLFVIPGCDVFPGRLKSVQLFANSPERKNLVPNLVWCFGQCCGTVISGYFIRFHQVVSISGFGRSDDDLHAWVVEQVPQSVKSHITHVNIFVTI